MGLRFISNDEHTVLYDSTSEWAFGPVFNDEIAAERFLDYAEHVGVKDGDVRQLGYDGLIDLWERYAREVKNPYG